jgi:hypothetical protein
VIAFAMPQEFPAMVAQDGFHLLRVALNHGSGGNVVKMFVVGDDSDPVWT